MTREQLAAALGNDKASGSALDVLNEREVEVISLMSAGNPSSFICRELAISTGELDVLKKSIMGKCKLKDNVALVQFAARQRII